MEFGSEAHLGIDNVVCGEILRTLVCHAFDRIALLHDGAILLFGVGASKLGPLGVAVGYAAFMSFAIIVGNINGFLTKEWKGAGRQSVAWIAAGILVLVIGVSVLAKGNFMQGEYVAQQVEKPVVGEE